jgi:hypothetical protein
MKIEILLQQLKVPTRRQGEHHHARTGWIQIDCPFCSKDSGAFRLGYSLAGGYLNCWTCGRHRLLDTLHELTGLPTGKLRELTKGLERDHEFIKIARGKLVEPKGVRKLTECYAHQRYIAARGLNYKRIERLWEVGAIGIAKELSWRLYIPIVYRGEVVSWTTRSLAPDARVRYVSASPNQEALNHKDLLYGEDYARHAVIVHEGPIDVWTTGPGAVATLGTSYSRAQVERLSRFRKRIVCFDNSPDAQARARQLCCDLRAFNGETYNIVLSGKDANETPKEEIKELRRRFLGDEQ